MKILFLVQDVQRANLDPLYDGVCANSECDLRRLSGEEQTDLKGYFKSIDVGQYERIMMFLRFKKEIKQARFISTIPNLCILEHDAYQNYVPGKYCRKFSHQYAQMPSARIISSGFSVSRRLREEGFDAVFVPKGYDQNVMKDLGQPRDVELGFLGSTKKQVYAGRKEFLDELAVQEGLQAKRTATGEDYLREMNRIKFFVSCDMGFGEYMIKNFEAMASGCVLMTYDQGAEENCAVGFKDMENVVLYRDLTTFREKLAQLRENPELTQKIANAGRHLSESRYKFSTIGRLIVEALQPPLRPQVERRTWISRLLHQ